MVICDGKQYFSKKEIPDFGSIICTETLKIRDLKTNEVKNMKSYEGLNADASKLPTREKNSAYSDLATGSSFFAIDTGNLYKYESTTDRWYQL